MKTLKKIYKDANLNIPTVSELNKESKNPQNYNDYKEYKLSNNESFYLSKDINSFIHNQLSNKLLLDLDDENFSDEKIVYNDIIYSSKIEGINLDKKNIPSPVTAEIEKIKPAISLLEKAHKFIYNEKIINHDVLKNIKNIFMNDEENFHGDNPTTNKEDNYRDDNVQVYKNVNGSDVEIHKGMNNKHIKKSMEEVFNLINNPIPNKIDDLILRTAISHVIFEYIHPYFDGNGRIGRLIVFDQIRKSDFNRINIIYSQLLENNKGKYYSSLEHSQKTKILDYFVMFNSELLLTSLKMSSILYLISSEHKLSSIQFNNLKYFLILGISTRDINYPSIKSNFKNITKQAVIKQLNLFVKIGIFDSEVIGKDKFFRLKKKYCKGLLNISK